MTMTIDRIWEELSRDDSVSQGLLLRRYSGSVLPDVFIALTVPEHAKCIAVSISSSVNVNLVSFASLKDITLEVLSKETGTNKVILLIKLLSAQHADIFSVLCEDLIATISKVTSETRLVKELLDRFEKWNSLFDKASSEGLTQEQQRGLFGELYFIRKYLHNNPDYLSVINSWVGAEKQIKDFQSGTWGVEVKTSYGNNHQEVQISSERQLDTSNFENLFLYHLSLEARQQSGERLNEIVDSISALLSSDFASLNRFRNKLFEGGYFDRHKHLYDDIGYFIRQETFYKVYESFPRVEEKDLRKGVGGVKYSIIVSQCSDYVTTDEQVFQTLVFA
jgi:hypothetical protein